MNQVQFTESAKALNAFCKEIGIGTPRETYMPRLQKLLKSISHPDHLRLAHAMLTESNNLGLKALAVEQDPQLGKKCADDLMNIVREYLKQSTDVQYAREAQTLLYYAQAWYQIAGALTTELDLEIRQGLDVTAWVHRL